jgi:hypothetical protein
MMIDSQSLRISGDDCNIASLMGRCECQNGVLREKRQGEGRSQTQQDRAQEVVAAIETEAKSRLRVSCEPMIAG